MKIKRLISWIFACVPLIITLIVLPTLPDKIPAHYGIDGNVNRFGSKYEMLILPVITIAMGFFWILIEKIISKDKEKGGQSAKILFWANIIMTAIFTIMAIWFLRLSYTEAKNIYANDVDFDFMKALAVCLGVSWIIIGNLLPKCKQNWYAGIRTAWTLKSEITWYKTHRLGGKLIFIDGIISTVLCLFVFNGIIGLIFSCASFIIIMIPIIIYSYIVYKKEVK